MVPLTSSWPSRLGSLAFIASLSLYGCDGTETRSDRHEVAPSASTASPEVAALPSGVEITVIDEDIVAPHRRGLDVRLSRRVTEAELRAIANNLKERESEPYERTFIVYYLPEMEIGAGGWATSHFDPDLEIQILGASVEEDSIRRLSPISQSGRDIVGVWADDRPFQSSVTIFREGGRTFVQPRFADGSGSPIEVRESRTSRGTRFQAPGGGAGDHYLLTPGGDLEIRDNEGLIATARPMGNGSAAPR
jgi:hypothetical protein